MKKYEGIDVSLFQGNPDFKAIKAAGIDFVIVKASQGRTWSYNAPFTDPLFKVNVKAALDAGLYVGAYHYYTARNDVEMRQEAEYFVNVLNPYKDKLQLWAAVDVEDEGFLAPLTYAARTAQVKGFCDIVRAAGFRPAVYTSSSWINNYFTLPAGVPLWEANWSAKEMMERARVWQYSSTGSVPGVSGNVDMNVGTDIIGDANRDGKVNLTDVTAMLKKIAGWGNDIDEPQADINVDGKVNLADVVANMKNIAGYENKPAEKLYTVKNGDSFWSIAEKQLGSGARWKEIPKLNGLSENAVIHPGDVLKLPK